MKHVLVTGGAGFIGSHLSRRFLDEGYGVTILDNLSTGFRSNVPEGSEFVELDVAKRGFSGAIPVRKYEAVCHLAGQSSGEKSFDDPVYDMDANCGSTVELADWALKNKVSSFVYASSMGVYGQAEQMRVDESTPAVPISFYGGSKLAAENALRVFGGEGLRTCCLRMFTVYGPGQNYSNMKQGMVSIFLAYLLKGQPILVKGSPRRVRDFVYIDDVVDMWMRAVERQIDGVFNVGTGQGTSLDDLLKEIFKVFNKGQEYPVEFGKPTPGDQTALFADITRARSLAGWNPGVSLTEGLSQVADWIRQRPEEVER